MLGDSAVFASRIFKTDFMISQNMFFNILKSKQKEQERSTRPRGRVRIETRLPWPDFMDRGVAPAHVGG